MNNFASDNMTRPVSDDMSMDEILSSIRKIIASDEEQAHVNNTQTSKLNVGDNPNEVENLYNEALQQVNNTPKNEHKLSASEQLASFTAQHLGQLGEHQEEKRPVYQKVAPHNNAQEQDYYEDTNNDTPDEAYLSHDASKEHDEEILRALSDIRDNLSMTYARANNNSLLKENIDQKNTANQKQNLATQKQNQNQMHVAAIDQDNTLSDIDLKPVQFSGDEIPKFLQKFKSQQQAQRQEQTKSTTKVGYDFSAVPKFDEPEEIVTLTDPIMPSTLKNEGVSSADKYQQAQNYLSDSSSSSSDTQTRKHNVDIAALRNSTEEVMQRATERNLLDNQDLHNNDSPMTMLIMRTLKPMLQEWIDKNMQLVAEEVLRDEFRRGLT